MSTTSSSSVPTTRAPDSYDPVGAAQALFGPPAQPDQKTVGLLLPSSLTDRGMAKLFLRVYGDLYRYVPGIGWYRWAGHRWVVDMKSASISNSAYELAERMPFPDPRESHDVRHSDAELRKHRRKYLNASGNRALVSAAQSLPDLMLDPDELDADPHALCTPEGVVNLRTGGMVPPAPHQFHTRSTVCAPRPMPTPLWDQFLTDTFGAGTQGREMITYLQQLCGYTISGDVKAQVLAFLFGEGQNGKSVLVSVLLTLMGEYADSAPPNFLMASPYPDHATDLADLQGRRLVVCSEINPGAKFDEAKFKLLTGGDKIKARRLYENPYSFWPTHKLWLIGNHRPSVEAGGFSFWRRMRLVSFDRIVDSDKLIDNLAERLVAEEGPGILQWLIDGAVQYFASDDPLLQGPKSVSLATKDYADSEDSVGRFVSECCTLGEHALLRVEQRQLRLAYEQWCQSTDMTTIKPRDFGAAIRRLTRFPAGKPLPKSNGRRYYVGIGLLSEEDQNSGGTSA